MLHQIRHRTNPTRVMPEAPPTLTGDNDSQILLALAQAVLPAGRYFPAPDHRTVVRTQELLASLPEAVSTGYHRLLTTLDRAARLTRGRGLAQLSVGDRLAFLESWRRAGVARRLSVRALLAPLKLAHFDNRDFYRHLGCVYDFDLPRTVETPRYMRERVHTPADWYDADDLRGNTTIECDVVVIGSGAGGAVVAKELAEMGHAVVILEEGRYFNRRDFSGRAFKMQQKMYRKGGWTFSAGNAFIPIPLGRTVGGTTTINSGTCYRTPGRVLAKWRRDHGLTEFTEAYMDPYYRRVEDILGVEHARPEFLGGVAEVIARGCDALGYAHAPLMRNAPECDGQGVCCFGCPTDAKRSTNVSYVPLALRAGAELFHSVKVRRILTRGDRAVGVIAQVANGSDHAEGRIPTLTVHARAVVVACGAIMTPALLAQNRLCNGSGQLGRNLSIHPAVGCVGLFSERVAGYEGIPQGYAIEEFHDQGLLFEGGTAPLEIAMGTSPLIGPKLIELAESWDRAAMFGFIIEDSSRGRVHAVGDQVHISYWMGRSDVARIKRGLEILTRVYFAAGAERVYTPVHGFDYLSGEDDLDRFRRTRLRARDVDLSAYHPLGTARMGTDRRRSVVDGNHESHDVRNLYIVDGASVPSSLAVNPQLTIMALATRAAERIDNRIGES